MNGGEIIRIQGDLFWGLLLIIIGTALILRWVFHINIPILRTVFAFIFIYLGLSILAGGWASERNNTVFQNRNMEIGQRQNEYNLIFSSGELRLASDLDKNTNTKKVNIIFSSGQLNIPPGMPVMIKSSTAFARTDFPDGSSTFFGEYTYRSRSFSENQNYAVIETNSVFSNLTVKEQ